MKPIASNTAFMAYGRIQMEITEHAIHMLAEMEASVEIHYRDFTDLAHGFEHVQRVYHLALSLSEQEQADGIIVGMAALLHDLGRTTRGPTRSHAARDPGPWLSSWHPPPNPGSVCAL
jgi:HD superfamily phosphodiesterase